MQVTRIRDGLWRWTVAHPAWTAAGSGAALWPEQVGCVYYEAPDATVVIDPLVPLAGTGDERRFWTALDADVARRGVPVVVLQTITWHERSCRVVADRYAAATTVPEGVQAIGIGDPYNETAFLIRQHAALCVGDFLVGGDAAGAHAGELRVCPASWYDQTDAATTAWYRSAPARVLDRFVDLQVEIVLVAHGTPVLADGAAALRRARAAC